MSAAIKQEVRSGNTSSSGGIPALICLSGVHRGKIFRLEEDQTYHLKLDSAQGAVVSEETGEPDAREALARFHPSEGGFELESKREAAVRLNGARVLSAVLSSGDMIELEDPPLLLKYGCVSAGGDNEVERGGLFTDCVSRTRFESAGWAGFATKLPVNMLTDFSIRSGLVFRLSVVAILAVLAGLLVLQWDASRNLERQLAAELAELATATDWVRQQQDEFISRDELNDLSLLISSGLSEARQRVTALEVKSSAAKHVVTKASRAIVFLQGAWVYQERATGRKMRYVVSEVGGPILTLDGRPVMSFDGEGPVASNQFSGTAFVISASGRLMTNRHVARPWVEDPALEVMQGNDIEPVFERFIGYLPGIEEPFDVVQEKVSSEADLAILKCSGVTGNIPHIGIAEHQPSPGDEVFVLGYPTGLRALVARSSQQFIDRITAEELDFWSIARALAEQNLIQPLASRGIVGQVSVDAIAYDADTTKGGSGGPVLTSTGELVAVNAAILPEYGGSNLGVPLVEITRLMRSLELE
ncbi:MAG: trypsin-like peptidase domain-containing protein [Proteobacteria bacterium]|nr:trypsin-like peptidase domain-containing protein [Pseudomonadota bacterium]